MFEGYQLGYRHLHITGGEPLLWKGLHEAIDDAFCMGYKSVFMNSNGTLLSKDFIRRLSGHDGFSISVSLEGPQPLHDKVRGHGSYRQTERGIRKALEAGMDLCIFTTVTQSLLAALPRFIDDLYEKLPKIKHFSLIQLIRVKDDVFDLADELLDPKDFLELVRMVFRLNTYGHKTEVLNNPLAVVVSRIFGIPLIPPVLPLCRPGHLIVTADGNIALAHSAPHRFGTYKPGMIEKVLSSQAYRMAVGRDKTLCPSCAHAELCKENGMLGPSEWYRDMHPAIPFCKRVLDKALSCV
jgi:MoaA/NifB/PqqE/SkfB family radical SAM enzyme